MNKMSTERRAAVVKALAEGMSIRATVRLTGAAKDTVTKLLVAMGTACMDYHGANVRGVRSERIEADEIWAFVGAKAANATREGQGDIWTWTAIDADSKLMVSYLVGPRNVESCDAFMADLASRLAGRIQLTTDGLSWYIAGVERAFGYNAVDYAQLQKTYGPEMDSKRGRGRYSPSPECVGAEKVAIMGKPDMNAVSTSYVERQNLTMRMQLRRFTRLTNAFSKKVENHAHAVALHFMHYNFCRKHQTLTAAVGGIHTTPAMAAGITDHVWKVEELIALL